MLANTQIDPIHSKALPDLIAKLLAERQQVLVLFNRLAALKTEQTAARIQPLLRQFCQILVDYVALGHFEVYQCFENNAEDTERCRQAKRLGRELYPRIDATTQAALDFNDHYDGPFQGLNGLWNDLSNLGEQLANRIELEDRLIAALPRSVTS